MVRIGGKAGTKMDNGANNETISKSKQKREEQKKWAQNQRAARKKERMAAIGVAAAIVLILAVIFGVSAYRKATYIPDTVTASEDYSAMLKNNGHIDGVKTSDYISDFDPSVIEIEKSNTEYSDSELESTVNQIVQAHRITHDDPAETIADGDRINLDYVGTIDGVEFDGGNTNGAGTELVIGSGSYIDDFEQQLIGHHPGEDVTVAVTFPEDYSTEDLAGKDAEFAVHINSILETPEFNDSFVAENFPEYTSADAYKEHLREEAIANRKNNAIHAWLLDNYTLNDYPAKYLHHMKELAVTDQIQQFNQQAQMYQYFGMEMPYADYRAYVTNNGEQDYDTVLTETAQHMTAANLLYQKICEDKGISVSNSEYNDFVAENELTDEVIEYYGKPYIMQMMLREKALESIRDSVTVVETPVEETEATAESVEAETTEADAAEETAAAEDAVTEGN